jgi:hypothetical protein
MKTMIKNRIRSIAVAAGLAAVASLAAVGSAQAQVAWSVGVNSPGVSVGVTNAPVVAYPRYYRHWYPRYYAAAPIVYPAPVVEPVYVDPYYYGPTVVYPAGYWVGWQRGYVRWHGHWVHPHHRF